jgi:hypothetical protein
MAPRKILFIDNDAASRLPLVALSGDSGAARMQACMQAGFSDFPAKSLTVMPALVHALAVLLPGTAPESSKGASLITFLSAKGGHGHLDALRQYRQYHW